MAVVRNLLVRGGADFSGIKREMDKTQKQMNSFKEVVGASLKELGVAFSAVSAGLVLKDAIADAIKIESAMGQINRLMGDSAKTFVDWASTSAISFGMSKGAAIDFGRTYANIISGFAKDTGETMSYTVSLLKTSAVIAANTGRTMVDVMERIRSGMLGNTEAIEDLGVNVNVAMIQSTDAFKRFANGKSWNQLSFQVQQQIRYFAILEQATKKFGDQLPNNTQTQLLMFQANLANLQLALGQAFLPLLNVVIPILNRFLMAITPVIESVSKFYQALFGGSDITSQANAFDALSSSIFDTSNALTDAKNAQKGFLAGFDEINQIPTDNITAAIKNSTASSNSAASNKAAALIPQDNSASTYFKNLLKSVTDIFEQFAKFDPALRLLWPSIEKFGNGLIDLFGQISKPAFWEGMWKSIKDTTSDVMTSITKFFSNIPGKLIDQTLLTTMSTNAGTLYSKLTGVFNDSKTGVSSFFTTTWAKIATNLNKDTFLESVSKAAGDVWDSVKKAFSKASEWFNNNLVTPITTAINNIKAAVAGGITDKIKELLNGFFATINSGFKAFNDIKNKIPGVNKIPDIPMIKLAQGGIVNSPTMAMIGEAGSEMVVPLENTSFVDKLAGALGTAVMSAMQMTGGSNVSGSNKEVVLKIDGYTIARALNPYLKKELNRQGNTVISIV